MYACRLITWFDVLVACVAFCCSLSCFGFVVWVVWFGGLDVWVGAVLYVAVFCVACCVLVLLWLGV